MAAALNLFATGVDNFGYSERASHDTLTTLIHGLGWAECKAYFRSNSLYQSILRRIAYCDRAPQIFRYFSSVINQRIPDPNQRVNNNKIFCRPWWKNPLIKSDFRPKIVHLGSGWPGAGNSNIEMINFFIPKYYCIAQRTFLCLICKTNQCQFWINYLYRDNIEIRSIIVIYIEIYFRCLSVERNSQCLNPHPRIDVSKRYRNLALRNLDLLLYSYPSHRSGPNCYKCSYERLISVQPKIKAVKGAVFVLLFNYVFNKIGITKSNVPWRDRERDQKTEQRHQQKIEARIHALRNAADHLRVARRRSKVEAWGLNLALGVAA